MLAILIQIALIPIVLILLWLSITILRSETTETKQDPAEVVIHQELINTYQLELDEYDRLINESENPEIYVKFKQAYLEILKEFEYGLTHNYKPASDSAKSNLERLEHLKKKLADKETNAKLEVLKNQAHEALDEVWYDGN